MTTRRKKALGTEPSCLYPDEAELALVLLGPERAHKWPAIAVTDEKAGLPRVDRMFGGRYWPAVKKFYDDRFKVIPEAKPEPEWRRRLLEDNEPPPGRRGTRSRKIASDPSAS